MASSSFFWSRRALPRLCVRDGVFRVEFDGLAVGGDGLVQLLLVTQGVAEVVVGVSEVRVELEDPAVSGNRFVQLLLAL